MKNKCKSGICRLKSLCAHCQIPLRSAAAAILLCSAILFSPTQTFAQETQLTLHLENKTLIEVMSAIEKKSDYKFYYNTNVLDLKRRVNIEVVNETIPVVLEKLFASTKISYQINGRDVVLTVPGAEPAKRPAAEANFVKGTVYDRNGNPLIGASIILEGTTSGTTTGFDGMYAIRVSKQMVRLTVSFLGYVSQQVPAISGTIVDVVLQEDDTMMEDVVIVGYGSQKKANLTGAVAEVSFNNDATKSRPLTNMSTALSGMIPGLRVQQGSGTPGADNASLKVRGVGTLNGSDPYVLIDGMPGDLNQISPNDVASVTVLKDAASCAIYGSRAANGVILVTTKDGGSVNGIQVEYNGNVGFSKPASLFDIISDTGDHMTVVNNILKNSGQGERYSSSYIQNWREKSKTDPMLYPNTDWWDVLIKSNIIQTHSISARGSSDRFNFYTAANYQYNDGMIPNTSYESLNLRSNVEFQATKWLRLGNIMTGLFGTNDPGNLDGIFTWFMATTPGVTPRYPDGRYGGGMTIGEGDANNLLMVVNGPHGSKQKRRFTNKFYVQLTPLEGLSIQASYFRDYYTYTEDWVQDNPDRWNFQTNTIVKAGANPSTGLRRQNTYSNADTYVFDLFAQYQKSFGNHNLKVLAGFNQELDKSSGFSMLREGVCSVDVPTSSAAEDVLNSTSRSEHAIRSYFGRINYDFKGRYLLEVNLRADGSSRFKDHWGYFPSASVGWRLSEEKFWDGIRDAVSNLKLRVSYGCLGNNSVGNYDWQTVYGIGNTSIGGNIVTSFTPGALVNAGLHWEETNVFDAGLDISFLKDFSLSLDYYNKFTHGILAREPISSVNGTGSGPLRNTAEVRNTGIEGFLSYNKRIRDWSIGVSINGAYNKNKVERYKNATLSSLYATYEGWPIGQFYLKEVDHIVQSQAEIDAMVADGFVFSDGKPGPGDFLYKNTYGDKRIDDKDKVFKGNPIPLFTYGANINAAWKGIDFNMILSGVAGYDRYIGNQFFSLRAETVGYLYPKSFLNMYTDEHPSTTHPRVYTAGNNKNQVDNDWHLHDASYLKIKTIQLGYTLPQRWTRKIRMERLRLYVNLENYFTFTSYPGLDPEVGSDITYPLTKTVSLGLNIKF